MKLKIPYEVIKSAIYQIESYNKNVYIDTLSLYKGIEGCEINYLYDLCNNEKVLRGYKDAYKDVKTTLDVVKAVLHIKLVNYCNEHKLSIWSYLNEIKNLKIQGEYENKEFKY